MITARQICATLDISYRTFNYWYKWYMDETIKKPEGMPELPLPTYDSSGPRTRKWKDEDVEQILLFKQWVPKGKAGVMGNVTQFYARRWKEKKKEGNK